MEADFWALLHGGPCAGEWVRVCGSCYQHKVAQTWLDSPDLWKTALYHWEYTSIGGSRFVGVFVGYEEDLVGS